MSGVLAAPEVTTAGGFLLVLAVVLPAIGVLVGMVIGGRFAERVTLLLLPAGLGVAFATAAGVWRSGHPLVYLLGGWSPPLGLALRADGLSALMLVTTAIVISGAALFARADFGSRRGQPEGRAPLLFWLLLLAVWAALNLVFLAGDLFNLYVALELLTFGAVPLVSLGGKAETLRAALRYLLFALLGSALYLLGTALLYGAHGTLDVTLLAARVRAEPVVMAAALLMTVGLLAKTALFPLHLWLPPAHAGAPAAASAVLSALVVKGSFFLLVRLWFDALPGLLPIGAAQILGTLGAAAIVFGSVVALQQARLKLLIAYSTVAQIGYLFFLFPLTAAGDAAHVFDSAAWTGGWMQLVSHAFAKAAMFMAAGLIAEAVGHDRIDGLGGIARVLPTSVFAFALGGLSLMGVPPSGGFVAKWLLLTAAVETGQWVWALVMLAGGLLAGAYVFRVLGKVLGPAAGALSLHTSVSIRREAIALAFALCAVALGFVALQPSALLQIGRPHAAEVVGR
jgi:formate hydrogenlyase subunit 3/multisubunit Na+/H+ antiporter MnhD subunit